MHFPQGGKKKEKETTTSYKEIGFLHFFPLLESYQALQLGQAQLTLIDEKQESFLLEHLKSFFLYDFSKIGKY